MKLLFENMSDAEISSLINLVPERKIFLSYQEQDTMKKGKFPVEFNDYANNTLVDFVKNRKWEYLGTKEFMLEKDALSNFRNGTMFLWKEDKSPLSNISDISERIQSEICFSADVHTIDIDNSLNNLMQKKNDIFSRPFRYQHIFFNRIFEVEPNIYSFGISAFSVKTPYETNEKYIQIISLIGYDYNTNKVWKGIFYLKGNKILIKCWDDKFSSHYSISVRKICKQTANIVANLFDFMNHPEVEPRVIKWVNNENRIKKGKLPIPHRVVLKITGKMYHYLYEEERLTKTNSRSINCSFEVAGHFFHFYSKVRFHRLYQTPSEKLREKGYQIDETGLIAKWVFPYRKGRGIFKTKPIILTKE